MSLLYFHAFLILCAVIFSLGFGFWEFSAYQTSKYPLDSFVGIGALVIGAGLLIYLIWFIRKKLPSMRR